MRVALNYLFAISMTLGLMGTAYFVLMPDLRRQLKQPVQRTTGQRLSRIVVFGGPWMLGLSLLFFVALAATARG
jgi:hypothetical protein